MNAYLNPFHIKFPHPEPSPVQQSVFPVFIPFSGCKQRCIFCAQEAQTGKTAEKISTVLQQTEALLLIREKEHIKRIASGKTPQPLPDLAFYGGTFTALPPEDLAACLDFAISWKKKGIINNLRCSTRPDAVTPALLASLRKAGFTLIELGIQSFSTPALRQAGRGYTEAAALSACSMVHEAGLSLGIQLMPGMPGVDLETAQNDVQQAVGLLPEYVRLYPCLVLEDTALASLWRSGRFSPWPLEQTLTFLARACLAFWQAGTRIIRMGVAPEEGLFTALLAGPEHPSLGSRARGMALALYIEEHIVRFLEQEKKLNTLRRFSLAVPTRYQGEFWGFRKELLSLYEERLGISQKHVSWHTGEQFILTQLP